MRISDWSSDVCSSDLRYPEHSQWIPQYKLEQVLRDKVQELEYVDFRIGTEFLSLEQRGDKVFVRARRSDTDEVETIEADYVVGADGARSKVRDAIGATMVVTRRRTENGKAHG